MIYLDNNATTPLAEAALEEMQRVSRIAFGNPGSRHAAGRKARQVLEDAREVIAEIVDCAPGELVFTSGGTESSNLAILGLTAGHQGVVILPWGEHPATEEPVKRVVQNGSRVSRLELDSGGQLVAESIASAPWSEAILATCLLAHNETGTIHDLRGLVARCEEFRVPLHVDAIQAVGKIPVSFRDLGATTMSLAGHKFHGPRGIGALVIRSGAKVIPQIVGGHQEQGLRGGTENVVLAAGMAVALQQCQRELTIRAEKLRTLRDRLEAGLVARCAPFVVNGDCEHRLPNTLNGAFPGCDADALLVALDLAGVCCSHGSACASGSSEPSPVLVAMKLPEEVYRSSIRFSVGMQNTPHQIEEAIEHIARTVQRFRS